jgi:Arc/MetJ family transcription regulator
MPTNLAIDDELLEKARRIGKHKTKRETVNTALREYIQRRKQKRVLSLFGKLDWISAYDYKARRRRSIS